MGRKPRKESESFDHNADHYPVFSDVLRRVGEQGNIPDGPIERLEVTCLASGEATYRVWSARADEPEGGYLPAS